MFSKLFYFLASYDKSELVVKATKGRGLIYEFMAAILDGRNAITLTAKLLYSKHVHHCLTCICVLMTTIWRNFKLSKLTSNVNNNQHSNVG